MGRKMGRRAARNATRQVLSEIGRMMVYISLALTIGELLAILFFRTFHGDDVWNVIEGIEGNIALQLFQIGHFIPERLIEEGPIQAIMWLVFQLLVLIFIGVRLHRYIFNSELRRRFHRDLLQVAENYERRQKSALILFRRYTSWIVKALGLTTDHILKQKGLRGNDRQYVLETIDHNVGQAVQDYRDMMNEYMIASSNQSAAFHRNLKEAMDAFERRGAMEFSKFKPPTTVKTGMQFDFWSEIDNIQGRAGLKRERSRRNLLMLGIVVSALLTFQYILSFFGIHILAQGLVEGITGLVAFALGMVLVFFYLRIYHYGMFAGRFRKGLKISLADEKGEGALGQLIKDTSARKIPVEKEEAARSRLAGVLGGGPSAAEMSSNPIFSETGPVEEPSMVATRRPGEELGILSTDQPPQVTVKRGPPEWEEAMEKEPAEEDDDEPEAG